MNENEDQLTAFHEVGHILPAYCFARPIERVVLEEANGHLGCAFIGEIVTPLEEPLTYWQDRLDLQHEISIVLGGAAAERVLGWRTGQPGWSIDRGEVRRALALIQKWRMPLLSPHAPSESQAQYAAWLQKLLATAQAFDAFDADGQWTTYIEPWFSDVTSLLDEHWSAVEAVAHALLQERQLSGQQVRRLIKRATGERGYRFVVARV